MKSCKLIAATVSLVGCAFIGSAQISDNFDSYANKTAFDAVWTPSVGLGLDLNTNFLSSPNSVMNGATTTTPAAQSRQLLGTPAPGHEMSLQFDFYDYSADNSTRDYGMMYSRAGTDWTGGLNQLLAIGKYNNGTAANYYGRIAFESLTYTLGDGAVATSGGWFLLNAANSVGWHNAQIVGMSDPINTGMTKFEFYIDSNLAGSVANVTWQDYNWVVLGSGLTSSGGFVAFDNLVVTVPEPSTLALGLVGGLGLLWVLRRRTA